MYQKVIFLSSYLLFVSYVYAIQVKTEDGLIEGKTISFNDTTIFNFMGIPFAEPPLNELRFRKPIPKRNKFDGIYKAIDIKPQCVSPFNTSELMDEDCLHLNIWTKSVDTKANLPVMFWIHGGSYIMGSATKLVDGFNIFDGTQLALRDVVVITANHRLGVFGFLFGKCDEAPGNMGMWDHVRALEWTRDNIRNFGGNPNDITLFGVSAGSISISAHIVSPVTRNLFHKSIMESGSAIMFIDDLDKTFDNSREFAANHLYFPKPCKDDNNWIQCLRGKSMSELNSAQALKFYDNFLGLIPFKPVIGDQFLPKTLIKSLKDGDFKTNIQLLMGHSLMEGVSFAWDTDKAIGLNGTYNPEVVSLVTKERIKKDIKIFASGISKEYSEKISNTYTEGFPDQSPSLEVSRNLIRSSAHAYGDASITCPTIIFGAELAKSSAFNGSVYQYKLTYANSKSISYGSNWAEAEHTDEQPLVFGRPLNELNNNWTSADRNISEEIMKIWTNFAKYGKPPLINGNQWPEYQIKSDGNINASYVELNPYLENSQRIHTNSYRGNDGFCPRVINNCLEFWFDVFSSAQPLNRKVRHTDGVIAASLLTILYKAVLT